MPVGEVVGAVIVFFITANLMLAMIALYILVMLARRTRPDVKHRATDDHAGLRKDVEASVLMKLEEAKELEALANAVQKAATGREGHWGMQQYSWQGITLAPRQNLAQEFRVLQKLGNRSDMCLEGLKDPHEGFSPNETYVRAELALSAAQTSFMRAQSAFKMTMLSNIRKVLKLAKANKTAIKKLSKRCGVKPSDIQVEDKKEDEQTKQCETELIELAKEYVLTDHYLRDAMERTFDDSPPEIEISYCPALFKLRMRQLWIDFQFKCYGIRKHPRMFFNSLAKEHHWGMEAPELTILPGQQRASSEDEVNE